jgi:DNA invertase Pin-like site-specific DNA recombinase
MTRKQPTAAAFSYVRFSHPSQAAGDSLRRQTEATEDWCRRNGVSLDTSLTLHDLGKSAFAKPRRSKADDGMARVPELADLVNPDRQALTGFLEMIRRCRIPRGAYLVIENLDRLSRDDVVPATHLLTGILLAGVRVVQMKPVEKVLTEKADGYEVMLMVMELSRGHGESAIKSERVGGAWNEKRERARRGDYQKATQRMGERSKVLTHQIPAWTELSGGGPKLVPAKAAVVKRIFRMAAAGYGRRLIAGTLHRDKVPPFVPASFRTERRTGEKRQIGGHWNATSVGVLLGDRRVLGEYQPHHRDGRPAGDPIPAYFPAVVSEEEFLAARAAVAARRGNPGRIGNHVGLFAGLLRNALEGDNYFASLRPISNGRGKAQRVLINANHRQGRAVLRSFPEETFEAAILSALQELDPRDVLAQDDGPDESDVLAGELARVRAKKAELEAELLNGDVAALANVLRQLEAREGELVKKLDDARYKAAHPLRESWGDCRNLLEALGKAKDTADVRLRLRTALRRIVERMWLVVVPRGHDRLAAVQVYFSGGGYRDYLIIHRPPRSNGKARQEGRWYYASARDWDAGDLRDPEDAAMMKSFLEEYPRDLMDRLLREGHPLP